jgi:hypothetical protein
MDITNFYEEIIAEKHKTTFSKQLLQKEVRTESNKFTLRAAAIWSKMTLHWKPSGLKEKNFFCYKIPPR